jgi:meiosis-specific APC/C activator protein AMA1
VGTIWTVGGLAPVSTGIPNGRGGLLGSGTNAPLYTTSFSIAKPKAKDDIEKHEGRLAEALKFDRIARVLEFRGRAASPQKLTTNRGNTIQLETKTTWNGTEWEIERRDLSKSNVTFAFLLLILTT